MQEREQLHNFIKGIPKAELHVHLEGTLEPKLLLKLADRNRVLLPYKNVEEVQQAYQFSNLQQFLDIYNQSSVVLIEKEDFYDLTISYLTKLHHQNVLHAELMFDPQLHLHEGVSFYDMIEGIHAAMNEAYTELGITSKLILCILRHLTFVDAIETLHKALPYKDRFHAIGLDSSEIGHPPMKFARLFKVLHNAGIATVAHAGEEGPASNIKDALQYLFVSRIDHGNSAVNDPDLMAELKEKQVPLTLCPLSNLALKVVSSLQQHPLKVMMEAGLLVTINSDDPAYFGGHLNDNYIRIADALHLTKEDITQLAINSFKASFLPLDDKLKNISRIMAFTKQ